MGGIISFIIGIFAGTAIGVMLTALVVANGRNE